jgi:hypothetical protein
VSDRQISFLLGNFSDYSAAGPLSVRLRQPFGLSLGKPATPIYATSAG